MGIGCCCHINVQAVIQQPFKHAASFACLYIQYHVSKLPAVQHRKGLLAGAAAQDAIWALYAMSKCSMRVTLHAGACILQLHFLAAEPC